MRTHHNSTRRLAPKDMCYSAEASVESWAGTRQELLSIASSLTSSSLMRGGTLHARLILVDGTCFDARTVLPTSLDFETAALILRSCLRIGDLSAPQPSTPTPAGPSATSSTPPPIG
jgi:hypothetical protein